MMTTDCITIELNGEKEKIIVPTGSSVIPPKVEGLTEEFDFKEIEKKLQKLSKD